MSTLLTLLGYSWTGPQADKDPALPALLSRLAHSSIFLRDKPSFVASRQENFMGDYQKRLSLSTIASLGRNSYCVTSCLSYFLQCPLQFSPLCLKQTTESLLFPSLREDTILPDTTAHQQHRRKQDMWQQYSHGKTQRILPKSNGEEK